MLELIGLSAGLVLTIPGALFEVAFGLTLIVRGFPDPVAAAPATERYAINDRLGASA
jgi:hypothetical protein